MFLLLPLLREAAPGAAALVWAVPNGDGTRALIFALCHRAAFRSMCR